MDRDADRVGGGLDIAHELPLAAGEADAADDKDDQRDRECACGKIILPERSGRGDEQEHRGDIPDGVGVEQP